jgi:nucleoside-diphosphate-sugar epimerase
MKIFLTGTSGFVGSHLLRFLEDQGHQVLRHFRPHYSSLTFEQNHNISNIDLFDEYSLVAELRTIDIVIHCGAFVGTWGKEEDFYQNNILLTQSIIHCAKQAGVKQLIYLSCASVVMNQPKALFNIEESLALTHIDGLPYSKSKGIAEQLVLDAGKKDLKTIALRPSFIWGSGDIVERQIGQAARVGKFGWFNQGDYLFSTCYIENLHEAISKAMQSNQTGQAYFISDGEAIRFRSFMEKRLQMGDYPIPSLSFPNWFAWALARFTENGWKYLPLKGSPPITREMVRLTGYPFTVSIEKAQVELGYQPKYSVEKAFVHLSGLIPNALIV